MNRQILRTFSFVALTFYCDSAMAQKTRAARIYDQAVMEFKNGNYVAACTHFEESFELDENLGTLLSLASCLNTQDKPASALIRYRQFLKAYSKLDSPTKAVHIETFRRASNEVRKLESRVPHLHLRMPGHAPRGLVVWLDGFPLSISTIEERRIIDPGKHRLTVKVPGHVAAKHEIYIKTAQSLEVPIPLGEAMSSESSAFYAEWNWRKIGFVGASSVAAFGLLMWIGPGLHAKLNADDVNEHCPNSQCVTPAWTDKARTAQKTANTATVGLVAFAVPTLAIAAFFTIDYFAGRKKTEKKSPFEIGVWKLDSRGALLGIHGSF